MPLSGCFVSLSMRERETESMPFCPLLHYFLYSLYTRHPWVCVQLCPCLCWMTGWVNASPIICSAYRPSCSSQTCISTSHGSSWCPAPFHSVPSTRPSLSVSSSNDSGADCTSGTCSFSTDGSGALWVMHRGLQGEVQGERIAQNRIRSCQGRREALTQMCMERERRLNVNYHYLVRNNNEA